MLFGVGNVGWVVNLIPFQVVDFEHMEWCVVARDVLQFELIAQFGLISHLLRVVAAHLLVEPVADFVDTHHLTIDHHLVLIGGTT